MPQTEIHLCQCPDCQEQATHSDQELHHQMNLFFSRLDEQQRRWYAAVESNRIGHGGDQLLSLITGLDLKTIRRGRAELDAAFADRPADGVRLSGAGRPLAEKKTR